MSQYLTINNRQIGPGFSVYVIAELSANHNQNFDAAVRLVNAAKEVGADAIKLQTYTPDTLTIPSDKPFFQVGGGTLWDGCTLYDLYSKAYTPWDWQPKLKALAEQLGIDCFSTPFDATAVDFLEEMNVPAHKIASFELVDLPLIRYVAQTRKPIIMSTGMATLAEIDEAVRTAREAGGDQIALLKCNSCYPAPVAEMHLRTIPHMAEAFGLPVGLSDHTLDAAVPVAAVVLGACIIEKHLTLSRDNSGPDSRFSLEPHEFKNMVAAVRTAEKAMGSVHYDVTPQEEASRVFRRSLFVVKDIKAGELFTIQNVRSIRPSHGLHTRHLEDVLGRKAAVAIAAGTPLAWDFIGRANEAINH